MSENKAKAEAEAVAEIIRAQPTQIPVTQLDLTTTEAFFLPKERQLISLESLREKPKRIRAHAALEDPASFIAYLKRFPSPTMLVTASEAGHRFDAILDYHGPNDPAWGEHTAKLELSTTPEWDRWIANDRQALAQAAFAEFLEDNLPDIVKPDGAALLELVQNLQGTRKVSWKSQQRLSDGQTKVIFDETLETGGQTSKRSGEVKLPQEIRIKIAPFVGVSALEIPLRLRVRISEHGAVSFAYLFPKPEEILRTAWQLIRGEIAKQTGLPVLLGAAHMKKPSA